MFNILEDMEKKYYIKTINHEKYNAGKARTDCNLLLENNGYEGIPLGGTSKIKVFHDIQLLLSCFTLLYRVPRNCRLLVQIPLFNKLTYLVYWLILLRTRNLEILIHDLTSIRINSIKALKEENYIFSNSKIIIVHTIEMQKLLCERGVDPNKIKILYLFDYLTITSNIEPRLFSNRIVFAGDLAKSKFIYLLHKHTNLIFHLYGTRLSEMPESSNIKYLGRFDSNDVSSIKGDWGLVWDGVSDETCSGLYGNYMRYNSSHKISLYIVAELPIIIWSRASLSSYITENKLGIAVDSISDIPALINSLSKKDKIEMKMSLKKHAALLKGGKMLDSILKEMF